MITEFAGLSLNVPDGWNDISAEIPSSSPPTLARKDGVGAIQFTVARYKSGAKPNVTKEDLKNLLLDLWQRNSFASTNPSFVTGNNIFGISATSITADEVICVWYISDGINIALITYTSLDPEDSCTDIELSDATKIVTSIEFN